VALVDTSCSLKLHDHCLLHYEVQTEHPDGVTAEQRVDLDLALDLETGLPQADPHC